MEKESEVPSSFANPTAREAVESWLAKQDGSAPEQFTEVLSQDEKQIVYVAVLKTHKPTKENEKK
tara:strand:+ start:329 stop:523 length:195 start_codon:yes stop_codon:yes gene_type:complete